MIQEVVCQDARLPCTQWGLSNPGNVEDQSQIRNQCHGVFHPFPSPNFPILSAFQPPSPELHKLWTFAAECRLCYCRPWGSVGSWEGSRGVFQGEVVPWLEELAIVLVYIISVKQQLWSGKNVHLGVMFLYVLMFVYLVFARNLRGLGAGVLWTSQGSYFSLGCPEMMAASVVSARVHLQHSFEARTARVLLLCFCLKLCETYQRHAKCLANYAFFKHVRPCHAFPNCLVLYIHDLGDLGKLG